MGRYDPYSLWSWSGDGRLALLHYHGLGARRAMYLGSWACMN